MKVYAVTSNGNSSPLGDNSYASMDDHMYIHEEYVEERRALEYRKEDNPNIYTNTPRQSRSSDEQRVSPRLSEAYEVMHNGFDSYEASPPYRSTMC